MTKLNTSQMQHCHVSPESSNYVSSGYCWILQAQRMLDIFDSVFIRPIIPTCCSMLRKYY